MKGRKKCAVVTLLIEQQFWNTGQAVKRRTNGIAKQLMEDGK
jgi:hypothetical protein